MRGSMAPSEDTHQEDKDVVHDREQTRQEKIESQDIDLLGTGGQFETK